MLLGMAAPVQAASQLAARSNCVESRLREKVVFGQAHPRQQRSTGSTTVRVSCRAGREQRFMAAATPPLFEHVVIIVVDKETYLSGKSKAAMQTAAQIARSTGAKKLTCAVIDDSATPTTMERHKAIAYVFEEAGWPDFQHVERPNTQLGQKTAVAIGEIADEVSADLVVLSSDVIHKHAVDANLLAEFVSCPIVLVPM